MTRRGLFRLNRGWGSGWWGWGGGGGVVVAVGGGGGGEGGELFSCLNRRARFITSKLEGEVYFI